MLRKKLLLGLSLPIGYERPSSMGLYLNCIIKGLITLCVVSLAFLKKFFAFFIFPKHEKITQSEKNISI